MSIIGKIFNVLETRLVPPRLSIWRTLYFNFRTLPTSQAVKLPIYIYGRVHFPLLAGKVEIKSPAQKGMIKIGKQDPFRASSGNGFISISPESRLIFNGPAIISSDVCIRILAGEIEIGKYVLFGSDVKVIANGKHIEFGDYTRIAFQTVITNSSFHSIIDLNTLTIKPHIKDVIIGSKCWIGNSCSISGGTKLKDGTIVGAGSYVNKDFKLLPEEHQMLAGRPAKLLKSGLSRIWSPELEMRIIEHFRENPDEMEYHLASIEEDKIEELDNEYK